MFGECSSLEIYLPHSNILIILNQTVKGLGNGTWSCSNKIYSSSTILMAMLFTDILTKNRWLLLHPLPTVLMSYTGNFLFFCFCMSPSSFNSNTHLVLISMFSSHKYIFYVYSLTNLVIKYFTHLQVVRSVPPPYLQMVYTWRFVRNLVINPPFTLAN